MRVGIVGTGGIARVHARVVTDLGGTLVGVCGRSQETAERFGGATAYTNVEKLLTEQRPDVVHICTPNYLHAHQAILAFQHGSHVICEKPLAVTQDESDAVIEAAHKAGRTGAVCYNYRGYKIIQYLKWLVEKGYFGDVWRIGGGYLCADVFSKDKYQWHFTTGTTGESYALMDIGVHWFDLAEFVTGHRITELSARFSTKRPTRIWTGKAGEGPEPQDGQWLSSGRKRISMALEEQVDLLLTFSNGASGTAAISTVSVGHSNALSLSIDGSLKGFDWHQENPNVYLERTEDGQLIRQRRPSNIDRDGNWTGLPEGQPEGYLDAFRTVVESCWKAFLGEESEFPSLEDGLRGVRLVNAAIRSARNKAGSTV